MIINPDEILTEHGITGKIAQVGIGFGTGRHSEHRHILKQIRAQSVFEEEEAKKPKRKTIKKTPKKERPPSYKPNMIDTVIQTDDPPVGFPTIQPRALPLPFDFKINFKFLSLP